MAVTVEPAKHFNCCTNNEAPDWTEYASLVLGGCMEDPEEEGYTIGNMPRADAEFFTVYGRDHEGLCMAITDIVSADFEEALKVGMDLAEISGLTLNIEC